MSEFFATHPELLDKFTQYVNYRITNAQNQQDFDTFNNVKQQLALDQNVNENQSTVITNNPDYQNIENIVRQEISSATISVEQSGKMPKCDINIVAQLLDSKDVFQNGIGLNLPSIQGSSTNVLDVNTFKILKSNYKVKLSPIRLTPDHIPSYGALALYFQNHGLQLPIRDDSNLEANSSAITVPTDIHVAGSRTFGGRNKTKNINGDSTMKQDASDLLEATVLDIATTAYLFYSHPKYKISPIDYIKNSITLVERNKLLCMYDVK